MLLTGESRLLSMRVLQGFVRETRGRWEPDEWRRLIERVRLIGFERIEEERIRSLVEANRERWLAGDNSVGPLAPVPAPAAAAGGVGQARADFGIRRAQLSGEKGPVIPGIPLWEPARSETAASERPARKARKAKKVAKPKKAKKAKKAKKSAKAKKPPKKAGKKKGKKKAKKKRK